MRRYLVVANQTLNGDQLVQTIVECAAAQPSEFFVVVPATPVIEMWVEAVMAPYDGGLCGPNPVEQARVLADERLKTAVAQLQAAGISVHGQVADRDPVRAVENALQDTTFDEIIVSTLPGRLSKWLHQDLPRRLEQRFELPVTHVGAVHPVAH